MTNKTSRLLTGVAAIALLFGMAPFASAQTTPAPDPDQDTTTVDEIVVTGIRGSIEESIRVKRNASSIVDAITAEDIGKLPDQNVTESLQRITGVQISRLQGEANAFTIRGISLNRVEINGRNFVGSSNDGTPRLEDINPEIFSGLTVIKSPTADQTEGGLGGVVNLLTKQPLDLGEFFASARLQGTYADQADEFGGRASGLVSRTFADNTFGVLLAGSYSKLTTNQYAIDTQGWNLTNAIDGTGDGVADPGLYRPARNVLASLYGEYERSTVTGAAQWRPTPELEFGVEATYAKSDRQRDSQRLQLLLNDTVTGARIGEGNTVVAGTYTNPTYRVGPFNEPRVSEQLNFGANAKYESGPLTVTFDVSYGEGEASDRVFVPFLTPRAGNTVTVANDFATGNDVFTVIPTANFNTFDPTRYQLNGVFDQDDQIDNDGFDTRFDVKYDLDFGHLRAIKVGARYETLNLDTRRFFRFPTGAQILAGRPSADANGDGVISGAEVGGLTLGGLTASTGYLSGLSGIFPGNFLTGHADIDAVNAFAGLGPLPLQPESVRVVEQNTTALYAMADFEGTAFSVPYRANAGVRFVSTDRTAEGFAIAAGVSQPVVGEASFDDILPSANISFDLRDDLVLRFAAARVLARPSLADVAPGVILNVVNLTGAAGNPELEPFKATQYDAALEWYFAPAAILSATVFYKDVNSFTTPVVTPGIFAGYEALGTFNVTRPTNGTDGKIQGFEIGYQQTLDFLPAPFNDFGVGANYTYTDSETPLINSLTGEQDPLTGLSENSYNLVAYYENETVSVRFAYTYRSEFLSAIQGRAAGGNAYFDAYGQLDMSASLQLTDRIKLNLEAINLLKEQQDSYAGIETRRLATTLDDTRVFFGLSASF